MERAIEKHNIESEKISKLKREYEGLIKKQKVEAREIDLRRKKELDDIGRMRDEEMGPRSTRKKKNLRRGRRTCSWLSMLLKRRRRKPINCGHPYRS